MAALSEPDECLTSQETIALLKKQIAVIENIEKKMSKPEPIMKEGVTYSWAWMPETGELKIIEHDMDVDDDFIESKFPECYGTLSKVSRIKVSDIIEHEEEDV